MKWSVTRRRATVRSIVSAAIALTLVAVGVAPASASEVEEATASLSGTVTDVTSGGGIADASVVVLDAEGAQAATAATGSTGGYTISGLAAGEYTVSVSAAPTHDPLFWPAAATVADAEKLTLTPAEARTGIDVALAPATVVEVLSPAPARDAFDAQVGPAPVATMPVDVPDATQIAPLAAPSVDTGAISGRVTRTDTGAPVEGIDVWAHMNDLTAPQASVSTDSEGNYVIADLPAGDYIVEFGGPWYASHIFVHEYWGGSYDGPGPFVSVVAGTSTSGVDASLEVGATISGVVSDAETGNPLAGVTVGVDRSSGELPRTAADGSYTLVGLPPADYRVKFDLYETEPPYGSVYLDEYWKDSRSYWNASLVSVGLGSSVTGIDAALDRGATISGVVTREDTGAPVSGVSVTVNGSGFYGSATTQADGTYTVTNVIPGEYTVSFGSAPGLAGEYWDDSPDASTATKVVVASGTSVTGIDAALDRAASVSGKVTREDTGAPVSGATVYLSGSSYFASATTGADGTYTVDTLRPGEYKVQFWTDDNSDLIGEYWENTRDWGAASTVSVATGAQVEGIDAVLTTSSSITGIVTRSDTGAPVSGVYVSASDGQSSSGNVSGPDGRYEIRKLPAGTFKVAFETSYSSSTAQLIRTSIDGVVTTAGHTTSDVNAALEVGGTISGMLRVDGNPWTYEARIEAQNTSDGKTYFGLYTPYGGTSGRYAVTGLPAGVYVVHVYPDPANGAADQYFSGVPTSSGATPVTVSTGNATSGIDFDLVAGVNITGSVTSSSGTPSYGATAVAYRWAGASWDEVRRVTAWGDYSFASQYMSSAGSYLPTGTYTVGFEAPGYCTQYWNNASSLDAATSFTPAVGTTQTGIDAVLSKDCATPVVTAGTPSVTGTPQVGQTLTAVPGTWAPAPVELAYQWLADGAEISGATGATFALTDAQLGKKLSVKVTGSRPGYTGASATSGEVGPVVAAPLPNVTAGTPSIAGTPTAGETLTATPGTWSPADVTVTYQWKSGGVDISGATGATFVPGADQVGKTLTVVATGAKAGYVSASGTSAPFGPIVAAPLRDLTVGSPTITGTPVFGQTLAVAPGTWAPAPVTLSYQWLVDGAPVIGATGDTFAPGVDAVGKTVSVTVLGTKPGYNPASVAAPGVSVVAAALTPGSPKITGDARVGSELVADPGTWAPDGTQLSFQWVVGSERVEGATGRTFTPAAGHQGKVIVVEVTGTAPGYEDHVALSGPAGPVTAGQLTFSEPLVRGTLGVAQELSVDVAAWGPAPLDLTYQWLANGTPIEGATGEQFTPDAALVGAELAVSVTATKPGYETVTRTAVVGLVPPTLTVSAPRALVGAELVVSGEHYKPGEIVDIELHSTPIPLGSVTADDKGAFTTKITVPAVDLNTHHIVAIGRESGLVTQVALEVYAPPSQGSEPANEGTKNQSVDRIGSTGGEPPIGLAVLGLALLAVGIALAARRRAVR